uniref:UNC93-like protein n=1 Tax=Timema monikensis TaxID=170555 RepID=A0A7R9ECW0_9NEOP|nr:unnamed protein product [Timema monikensis]
MPLSVWIGMQEGFMGADYTAVSFTWCGDFTVGATDYTAVSFTWCDRDRVSLVKFLHLPHSFPHSSLAYTLLLTPTHSPCHLALASSTIPCPRYIYGYEDITSRPAALGETRSGGANNMLHDVSPVAIYCNIRHCEVGNYRVYLQAYVSCAWGIRNIGYVMICYGVTNALSAVITGSLVRLTGRVPLVVCATVLHSGVVVGLLCWEPRSHDKAMFFVMSGLWGVADGVWQIQINAMYGVLFPGQEEAAFSNFKLCTSIGYILTYSYSSYICTDVKLYIISTLMLVGVAGYLLVEWKERNRTDTRLNKE